MGVASQKPVGIKGKLQKKWPSRGNHPSLLGPREKRVGEGAPKNTTKWVKEPCGDPEGGKRGVCRTPIPDFGGKGKRPKKGEVPWGGGDD